MTSKRRKWLIVLSCLALATTFAIVLTLDREPEYQGRPLTEWVIDLSPLSRSTSAAKDSARAAMQTIGPEAIPHLLEYMTSEPEDSPVRKPVRWMLGALPLSIRYKLPGLYQWAFTERNEARRAGVPFAFEALGPAATPAIPQLEQLIRNHSKDRVYWTALDSLAAFSTNAQPMLLSMLASSDPDKRVGAAAAYMDFELLKTNAEPAVPLLIRNLEDAHENTRFFSAWALGYISVPADMIVPALSNALNDPAPRVRSRATSALRRIAPEVLTNAPPP